MALKCSTVVSLVMLVAGCYCAPANLFDGSLTLGFDSVKNGTIGNHMHAERDGLAIKGGSNGIIGASSVLNLIAKGHARVGNNTLVAGDASLKSEIDNNWQPGFTGELGRTSNGVWVAGLQPTSLLKNKFILTPTIQLKTGDDARKLLKKPVTSDNKVEPAAPQMNPGYIQYAPQSYYSALYPNPYYQQYYFQPQQYPTIPVQQQYPTIPNQQ